MRPAAPDAVPSSPVRAPRWMFALLTALSLILGATSIVRGTRAVVSIADSDLTNFFLKSADYILNGDPFHMYAVRALGGYPNYNPPLSIFLMAPLLWLARLVGFAQNYGQQITFVTLPFIVLVPLLGYLCLKVMDRLYPGAPEAQRLLVYGLITLSPLTWQSYSIWYHVEQPLMLCFLVGAVLLLQQDKPELAGLLAGLAFLSRTTALIPLIAIGALLLLMRAWRPLISFAGIAGLVAVIGLAPFFLFDRADAMYTFVSWRSTAQIGSDSFWAIFAYSGPSTGTLDHIRYLLDGVAKRLDMYTVIVAVLIVVWFAFRRLKLTTKDEDLWALVALGALATPALSKQVWPYYYLEPFVFIVVWELATLRDRRSGLWRWPILSIGFLLVAGTFSQYVQLQSVGRGDAILLGMAQTVAMLFFGWAIWARMGARKPQTAAAGNNGQPAWAVQAQRAMQAERGATAYPSLEPLDSPASGQHGRAPWQPQSAPQSGPQTPQSFSPQTPQSPSHAVPRPAVSNPGQGQPAPAPQPWQQPQWQAPAPSAPAPQQAPTPPPGSQPMWPPAPDGRNGGQGGAGGKLWR